MFAAILALLARVGAICAGLSVLAVALWLATWATVGLTQWVEFRVEMRRWPGFWTRRLWSVECPTCGAPVKQLCIAIDRNRPVQVVPHYARVLASGLRPEWHSEAIRGYCGDAMFVRFGKRASRRVVAELAKADGMPDRPDRPA